MSTPLRLAAFGLALVVVFALAFAAGRTLGPGEPEAPTTPTHAPTPGSSPSGTDHPGEEGHDESR